MGGIGSGADSSDRQTQRRHFRIHRVARRWVVERTFAWICTHRPCVRDYETRPEHHEAMVYIALIATMSRPKTQCCSDSGRAGSDKHHRKLGHNRAVLPHDS
jgi:hypothetical protein